MNATENTIKLARAVIATAISVDPATVSGRIYCRYCGIGNEHTAECPARLAGQILADADEKRVDYHPGVIVKYHGPTNARGSRVSLELPGRGVPRKTIPYRYEMNNIDDMAIAALRQAGFSIEGRTDVKDAHVVLVSWPGADLPELWGRIGKK